MDIKKIKVLLFGTGAVGSFFGGKLAQAGASVSVVSRSDYAVVRDHGISIKSILGDFHFIPDRVLKSGEDYKDEADYIIVATKALPEINIYEMIKDAVTPGSSIILLQNGIDIEKPVFEKFPYNEITSAIAFIGVSRTEYGVINHQDSGRIILGKYPSGSSEKVKLLADMFSKSGIPVEYTEDVVGARWKKLLWNVPFNSLSVICGGADTRELLENREINSLCKEIMKEVLIVAEADGYPLSEKLINVNIENTLKMAPYKTSMLLDFENKRPMEVEAIFGNTLKIAEKYNIYPVNIKMIYALLLIINKKNLKR